MFCNRCGEKIEGNVRFCPNCGNNLNAIAQKSMASADQNIRLGDGSVSKEWGVGMMIFLVIISILIPIIGLIIGLYNKKIPGREKQSKNLIIISSVIWVLNIFLVILSQ